MTENQQHPERPEVVTLCGSTRFYHEFQQANYDLTMQGKIVLSVGFYPHAKAKHGHGEGVGHDSSEKVALDELHKRKIDMSDRVFVLNVGGYIGESTRGEIEHAHRVGVPVEYLEPVGPDAGGSVADRTTGHVELTRCGLSREDFADENEEPCPDGGAPNDHPSRDGAAAPTTGANHVK